MHLARHTPAGSGTEADLAGQIMRRRGMWYDTYMQDINRHLDGMEEPERMSYVGCHEVGTCDDGLTGPICTCAKLHAPAVISAGAPAVTSWQKSDLGAHHACLYGILCSADQNLCKPGNYHNTCLQSALNPYGLPRCRH